MTAKKTAQQDALAPVEAAVNAGKETAEAVMKAGTEAYARQYEQTATLTRDQVEKTSAAVFQSYDELVSLNKANLDAVVSTTTTFAKGFETLAKEIMGFTQINVESGMTATKKVLGAKNLQEMLDLQSEYSRTLFDSCIAESAKVAEMSMKTANEAFAPLQERAQVTVERIMKPAA
ncbi:MAG: phasin family protein [Tistlia sp.]|uniref:phasin family protein n=1 Tax=Tistlia sp. TaxID=3057121 RepID=UPI0034A39516